jgi:hypothetical protein
VRIEEVHARIHQLNSSSGRSLDPASTCGRLRRTENLQALQDWRCRAFVVHMWKRRRLFRDVIQPCMPQGFVDHARCKDIIQAIYYCLPRQLFCDIKVDEALHSKMQKARKPALPDAPAEVRMAVDYFKERLQPGDIFSVPSDFLQGALTMHGGAGPAAAEAALAHDHHSILTDALALVSSPSDTGHATTLNSKQIGHRWFRVIKSDLSRRFVQHDDGRRSFCISVMQVTLLDKVGGKGVFSSAQCSFYTLDLWAAIEKVGFASLLRSQILWNKDASPTLSLSIPALRDSSAQLAPVRLSTASSEAAGARRRCRVKKTNVQLHTNSCQHNNTVALSSVHSSKSLLPCGCFRFYGFFDA